MTSSTVSVVMAAYNAEAYIKKSIDSVLNQTFSDIQLIIVDDGSTDSTPEIIKSYSDPRIEIHTLNSNRHIAYATNIGLSYVKGKYLAIADADDIWYPEKLEKQLSYLAEHPEHKGCFTWVDLIDENDICVNEKNPELLELYSSHTYTQEAWLYFFFFAGNRLSNPSSLVYSDTISTIGLHNPFFIQAHDMDWWVRFTKHFSFGIIEEPLIHYRRVSSDEGNTSSRTEINETRFFNEHMAIRYHFFDDISDDLFIRTFKKDFKYPDASTPEELECEKAFLQCTPGIFSNEVPAYGLLKLEELMKNPETSEILYSRYGFFTQQVGALTGKHIFNDITLQEMSETYNVQKKNLIDLKQTAKETNYEMLLYKKRSKQLSEDVKILKSKLIKSEEKVTYSNDEMNRILDQNNELKIQLQNSEERYNNIINSAAWKYTKPFRKLKSFFTK